MYRIFLCAFDNQEHRKIPVTLLCCCHISATVSFAVFKAQAIYFTPISAVIGGERKWGKQHENQFLSVSHLKTGLSTAHSGTHGVKSTPVAEGGGKQGIGLFYSPSSTVSDQRLYYAMSTLTLWRPTYVEVELWSRCSMQFTSVGSDVLV